MLKFIYVMFLGLILALFVGFGIEAFYPTPKSPEYPKALNYIKDSPTAEQMKIQEEYDKAQTEAQKSQENHAKNASIVSLIASIVFLILSLTVLTKIDIISEGVLQGGLVTLFYGIGLGLGSGNSMYRFIVITLGMIIALILGYFRFIKPNKLQATK